MHTIFLHYSQIQLEAAYGQPEWYALHTSARHEKKVAEYLRRKSVEVFLPVYKQSKRWKNGVYSTSELPLFPGYLFTRISLNRRMDVLTAPGAAYLVGAGGVATVVCSKEVERLQTIVLRLNPEPHPFVKLGQKVYIKSGPLKGMEGILTEIRNRCRFVVSLDLIRQSFAVEVDRDQIEPVSACSFHSLPIGA